MCFSIWINRLTDYGLSDEIFKDVELSEDYHKYNFVGKVPLMVSEHDFSQIVFIDRKSKKFSVLQDAFKQKYMLVNMNKNVEISIHKVVESPKGKRITIYLN